MRGLTGLIISLFILLHGSVVVAQEVDDDSLPSIVFVNTFVKKGLRQRVVNSVVQDERGVLWLGTASGLLSFDGYEYKEFYVTDGLCSQVVKSLRVVGDSLFVATDDGLSVLDMRNGLFSNYYPSDNRNPQLNNQVFYISPPFGERIALLTANGFFTFELNTGAFEPLDLGMGDTLKYVRNCFYDESRGTCWMCRDSDLICYDLIDSTLRCYPICEDTDEFLDNEVVCVLPFSDEAVLVGTRKGLSVFNPHTESTQEVNLNKSVGFLSLHNEITHIHPYDSLRVLVGTKGNGLFLFEVASGRYRQYTRGYGYSNMLLDDEITYLFTDKQDNIWVCTLSGMSVIPGKRSKFRLCIPKSGGYEGPAREAVRSLEQKNDSEFWFGTLHGVQIYDRSSGLCNEKKFAGVEGEVLNAAVVYSIKQSDDGRKVWFGTKSHGIFVYHVDTEQVEHYHFMLNTAYSILDSQILALESDTAGYLWVGTRNGLGRLDENTGEFKVYSSRDADNSTFFGNAIFDIHFDAQQRLWMAADNGLYRYNYDNDDFDVFRLTDSIAVFKPHVNDCFYSITADAEGRLWLGTRNSGAVSFDCQRLCFDVIDDSNGLSSNLVFVVIKNPNANEIWMSTNKGTSMCNLDTRAVVNNELIEGLESNDYCLGSGLLSSNGEFMFGGYDGCIVFDPCNVVVDTEPIPVLLTSFVSQNQSISYLHDGDEVVLSPGDDSFIIDFAALDYLYPNHITYRYQLEGYDETWVERGVDHRFASFSRVPIGAYSFKVVAANHSGVWNKEPFVLKIRVMPFWYQTLWFKIALTIVLLLMLSFVVLSLMRNYRYKFETQKKYLEYEKQLYLLKQKSLQLQMNPHVLFNMLNSIQCFVLKNDSDRAVYYLSKFAMLMRAILSNSYEGSITLANELDAIKLYLELEEMRFEHSFTYEIRISPEIDENFVEMPPMILQPYVENSIIHGLRYKDGKGHLFIDISLESEGVVLCVVQDDGVGRERSAEIQKASGRNRDSYGMRITKERLDIINTYTQDKYTVKVVDLYDHDGKAAGTRIEVRIIEQPE